MSSRSLLKFVLPILRLRLTKVVKKCKNAFELSGSLIEKKKKNLRPQPFLAACTYPVNSVLSVAVRIKNMYLITIFFPTGAMYQT